VHRPWFWRCWCHGDEACAIKSSSGWCSEVIVLYCFIFNQPFLRNEGLLKHKNCFLSCLFKSLLFFVSSNN
jgi:hypothetical protein